MTDTRAEALRRMAESREPDTDADYWLPKWWDLPSYKCAAARVRRHIGINNQAINIQSAAPGFDNGRPPGPPPAAAAAVQVTDEELHAIKRRRRRSREKRLDR